MRVRSSRRRGAVAVLVVLCLTVLTGILAFAIDGGMMIGERRHAQAIADAAAWSAACSLYSNPSTSTAQSVALANASVNGYTNDGKTSSVTVNIPPKSGTFSGQAGYAEVLVSYYQPRTFSAIFGSGNLTITARAVARGVTKPASPDSLILLNPSASGALTLAGSGRVIASTAIQVNSSNLTAVNANNAGYAQAPNININGHYTTSSSGYLSGTVTTGASTVSDPLATLAAPSTSGLTTQGSIPGYGSFTINPGIYNGGLSFGGGSTVTMNPGTYYMKGGGFSVANGVSLTGSGVTIYVDSGGGQFSFQGGGKITLSAPTSGTYAGVVMYQDRANTSSISIANGSTTTVTGTIYAPSANVSFAGGASNTQFGSQFIAQTMNISNNADIRLNWSSGSVAGSTVLNLVQ